MKKMANSNTNIIVPSSQPYHQYLIGSNTKRTALALSYLYTYVNLDSCKRCLTAF